MGLRESYRVAGPDDPIYKEGLKVYTPRSARPRPSPERSMSTATTGQRSLKAMGTLKGSYSELGIEPPEPVSILTGRNIVPGSKKKSPASARPKPTPQSSPDVEEERED